MSKRLYEVTVTTQPQTLHVWASDVAEARKLAPQMIGLAGFVAAAGWKIARANPEDVYPTIGTAA